MRIGRTIAIVLIWVLLVLAACGKPASVTPAPLVPPTTPATPPLTTPPTPTTPPPPTPPPTPPATIPVQGPNEVWIPGREFRPNILTVPVGTKVTWTSKAVEPHTVTSGLFNASLAFGQSFSYTFTAPGTFEYNCGYHRDMTGKVIVQ